MIVLKISVLTSNVIRQITEPIWKHPVGL